MANTKVEGKIRSFPFDRIEKVFNDETDECSVESKAAKNSLPDYMKSALRKGLKLHEEGRSGGGLKSQTVRDAREGISSGWSDDKIIRASAWFARHASDKKPGWDKPGEETPGYVAWLLWGDSGSGTGRAWVDKKADSIREARGSSKAHYRKKYRKIKGYANRNTVDRGAERVDPMAFLGTMEQYMQNPVVFYNHDWEVPVGKVTSFDVKEEGLEVEVEVAEGYEEADKVWAYIEQDLVKSFSIGFVPKKLEYAPKDDYVTIKELELLEVSIVTIPMNAESLFSISEKGIEGIEVDYEGHKMSYKSAIESLQLKDAIDNLDVQLLGNSVVPSTKELGAGNLDSSDTITVKKDKIVSCKSSDGTIEITVKADNSIDNDPKLLDLDFFSGVCSKCDEEYESLVVTQVHASGKTTGKCFGCFVDSSPWAEGYNKTLDDCTTLINDLSKENYALKETLEQSKDNYKKLETKVTTEVVKLTSKVIKDTF